jgi:hypothetical protein
MLVFVADITINQTPLVKHLGWPSACPPESPLRHATFNLDVPPSPQSSKTFIYDHPKAMDPCLHPSLLHHHGQFLRHNHGPIPNQVLIPMFAYCSTSMHYNIISAFNSADPPVINPDFVDRLDERLLWRGTTTGMNITKGSRWRGLQRMRLVGWANERNGTVSVLQSTKSRSERVGPGKPITKARLNPAMLDVAFVNKAHQCISAVCEIIDEEFEFRRYQDQAAAANYKYILDVSTHSYFLQFVLITF